MIHVLIRITNNQYPLDKHPHLFELAANHFQYTIIQVLNLFVVSFQVDDVYL